MRLKPATNHFQRILTAAILIPIIFIILFWGGTVLFGLLVWAVYSIGNREVFHFLYTKPKLSDIWFFWAIGTLAVGAVFWLKVEGLLLALIFGSFFTFGRWIFFFSAPNRFYESMGKQVFALWYLPFLAPFFILIRMEPQGLSWIFFLLVVNYAGDTGAFYAGRSLGRHKLAPAVSPKKTVEGSIGGLAANLIAAGIFQKALLPDYPLFSITLLGLAVGVVSQMGDLLESMFKRAAGIKDSGSIFPGHGGLMDRIDSLLLPAPMVYFFIHFFEHGFRF